MSEDLKQAKLDDLEYQLSLTSTFKFSNLTNKSLTDCLIQSFEVFYNFIVNYKNSFSNQHSFELKERVFSIYIKQVVHKLQDENSKDSDKSGGESRKNLLNLLADHPKFFSRLAGSLNFMVLDVINNY